MTYDIIYDATRKSNSIKQASKLLAITPYAYKKHCKTYNIDISRFKPKSKELIHCKECNTLFSRSYASQRFCSSSCSARYNNSHRTRLPWSHDQKTAFSAKKLVICGTKRPATYTTKCVICNTIYTTTSTTNSITCSVGCNTVLESLPSMQKSRKTKHLPRVLKEYTCIICNTNFLHVKPIQTCSKHCMNKLLSQKMSNYLKHNRTHIRGNGVQSYMESSFEEWLNKRGYTYGLKGYLTEVHFYNKDTKKHGFADFVFPKLKLIIELDGSHHLKRKNLDDIRDKHLHSRGWQVIRITQKEYTRKEKLQEISNILKMASPERLELP